MQSVTVTLYHHGTTAGVPPTINSHDRAKRGVCEGWTASSTRSNTKFLYSVDETGLTGIGFALSLTVKDIPENHELFHTARTSFLKRLARAGMIRSHWLIEWQKRGAPHLHMAVWFDPDALPEPLLKIIDKPNFENLAKSYLIGFIIQSWLDITSEPFGARSSSQNVKPINDSVGWFKYLSKHASRGLGHYQRNSASIPKGWKKTGRMWGKTGAWSIGEVVKLSLSIEAFWAYRRIVRGMRIADARDSLNPLRLKSARKMLTCTDRKKSPVRGVSEWVEADTSLQVMFWLRSQGYEVES